MEQEKKDQRVTIMMSEKELADVDQWAHERRIKSRGEAVRQLLAAAIRLMPAVRHVRNMYAHFEMDSEEMSQAIQHLVIAYFGFQQSMADDDFDANEILDEHDMPMFGGGDMEALLEIIDFAVTRDKNAEPTERERFIVDRISDGRDDEAIATLMGVSERTVQSYVQMLMTKFGARQREDIPEVATVHIDFDTWVAEPPRRKRVRLKDK